MDIPVTKRAKRKAATREAVLRAARSEFHAQGYERTKIVDIARAADVSPGTVLNTAPTKVALLCEVLLDDFKELGADTATLAASIAGDLKSCIIALLELHLQRHLQGLELCRAAIGHNWITHSEDFLSLEAGFEIAWAPILDLLENRRTELPPATDPALLRDMLVDLYMGVLRRCVIDSAVTAEASQHLHARVEALFACDSRD